LAEEPVAASPQKLTRKLAEFGMPPSEMQKHLKVDLKRHPYLPAFIQKLIDVYLNSKRNALEMVIQAFKTIPRRKKSHL
jgi:hypothetical protein